MNRTLIAGDIAALAALDHTSLNDLSGRPNSRDSKENNAPAPATDVLDTLSIGTCTPNESQRLTKAYIESMRKDVMGIEDGKSEAIGGRIDIAREKAQGLSEAVGEVRP